MTDWQPIETAPKGQQVLLYFPAETGRNPLNEWIKMDRYPVSYPRRQKRRRSPELLVFTAV